MWASVGQTLPTNKRDVGIGPFAKRHAHLKAVAIPALTLAMRRAAKKSTPACAQRIAERSSRKPYCRSRDAFSHDVNQSRSVARKCAIEGSGKIGGPIDELSARERLDNQVIARRSEIHVCRDGSDRTISIGSGSPHSNSCRFRQWPRTPDGIELPSRTQRESQAVSLSRHWARSWAMPIIPENDPSKAV